MVVFLICSQDFVEVSMDQKKRKLEDSPVTIVKEEHVSATGAPAASVPTFVITKEDVKKLVEPFTKEQLMDLLENAALNHAGYFLSNYLLSCTRPWMWYCILIIMNGRKTRQKY